VSRGHSTVAVASVVGLGVRHRHGDAISGAAENQQAEHAEKTLAPAVAESSTANAKHHHGRGVRDNIGGLLVRHVDCRALHDDVVGLWVVAATRRCHRQELAAFVVGKRNVVAQATPFDRLREDELFAARQARDGVLRKLARHTTLEIDVHQLFPRFFVFFFSSFFSFLLARGRLD
jgi:hypothetical protein